MAKLLSSLKNPFWQTALLFALVKLGLHLFTHDNYELHRDEMLYFNQGDHPALGNATVPPLIGWVAFFVKNMFGHSVFGVRFVPMLLGAISVLLIAGIVKRMGGGIPALVLACTAFVLLPGMLLFHSLFTVNAIDQFYWLLISILFIRMVDTNDPKGWTAIGVAGGLAFLNKYLVAYLLAGFVLALLLTHQRKLLFNRHFGYGCLAGLLIIAPNIHWQYAHGWPFFNHVSELHRTQLAHMGLSQFFTDLFDLHSISLFFWLAGLLAILFLRPERKYRYLGIATLIVFLLFILSKGKAYYVMGLVPALLALSGYVFEKYLRGRRKIFYYLSLAVLIVGLGPSLPFALPMLPFDRLQRYAEKTVGFVAYPFSKWEDGKRHPISQVFSDMTGWKEMVSLVDQAYKRIPENERQRATIYAQRNYGYAGAVHFYGKAYGLPEAITFLDSYTLWAPDTIPRGPLVYINYEIAEMDRFFNSCTTIGQVGDPYFREKGLKVFLCTGPNDQLQEVYRQKALEEKRNYR